MRRSVDIQTDSEQLEKLALERQQLQHVLERLNLKEEERNTATVDMESKTEIEQAQENYFIKTSHFGSSFFQMQEEDVEEIVEKKLDRIEENIVQLCTSVQARLDSSTQKV
jgi:glycyl-tRNA synthetase alpha subunit